MRLGALRRLAQIRVARFHNLHRTIQGLKGQEIRLLLIPDEPALIAVHADFESVLLTRGNLRTDEHPFRPTRKAQQEVWRRRPTCAPGTKLVRSAQICSISKPVIVAARFSACEPMSPTAPAMPERSGSVRHSACLAPVSSNFVANQPWLYSTITLRSSPSCPARTICRACLTSG